MPIFLASGHTAADRAGAGPKASPKRSTDGAQQKSHARSGGHGSSRPVYVKTDGFEAGRRRITAPRARCGRKEGGGGAPGDSSSADPLGAAFLAAAGTR